MSQGYLIEPVRLQAIADRATQLSRWMAEHAPRQTSQKHLDEGTVEQAYWNFGYLSGVQDVLALIKPKSTQ